MKLFVKSDRSNFKNVVLLSHKTSTIHKFTSFKDAEVKLTTDIKKEFVNIPPPIFSHRFSLLMWNGYFIMQHVGLNHNPNLVLNGLKCPTCKFRLDVASTSSWWIQHGKNRLLCKPPWNEQECHVLAQVLFISTEALLGQCLENEVLQHLLCKL